MPTMNLDKIYRLATFPYDLIDLLISNNISSMTIFCATRILRVIGRESIRLYDSSHST